MIKTEHPFEGKETLIRTYTDDPNKVLRQVETDIVYGDEVVDVYPCRYTYEEVDKEPEPEPEPEPETQPE